MLPPGINQEDFNEAFEVFKKHREGYLEKVRQEWAKLYSVVLIDSNMTISNLLKLLKATPVNYYDPKDTRETLETCIKTGVAHLEEEWLFCTEAFKDIDALRNFCRKGLSKNMVYCKEPLCLSEAFGGLLKPEYLERCNEQMGEEYERDYEGFYDEEVK